MLTFRQKECYNYLPKERKYTPKQQCFVTLSCNMTVTNNPVHQVSYTFGVTFSIFLHLSYTLFQFMFWYVRQFTQNGEKCLTLYSNQLFVLHFFIHFGMYRYIFILRLFSDMPMNLQRLFVERPLPSRTKTALLHSFEGTQKSVRNIRKNMRKIWRNIRGFSAIRLG